MVTNQVEHMGLAAQRCLVDFLRVLITNGFTLPDIALALQAILNSTFNANLPNEKLVGLSSCQNVFKLVLELPEDASQPGQADPLPDEASSDDEEGLFCSPAASGHELDDLEEDESYEINDGRPEEDAQVEKGENGTGREEIEELMEESGDEEIDIGGMESEDDGILEDDASDLMDDDCGDAVEQMSDDDIMSDREEERCNLGVERTKRGAETPIAVCRGKRPRISSILTISLPSVNSLPASISSVLGKLQGQPLSVEQHQFFETEHYMPVSALQWQHFDKLLDDLSHILKDQGAVLIQPPPDSPQRTQSCNEEVSTNAAWISMATAQAKKTEWKTLSNVVTRTTCEVVDRCDQEPLSLPQFESGCAEMTSIYARDWEMSEDDTLLRQLGVRSRLSNLAGDELKTIDKTPGVNSPYYYGGSQGSSFALHSEDENTHSVNICYSGCKTWVIIAEAERQKLEKLARSIWTTNYGFRSPPKCDQFIRHLNIFIPSTTLQQHEIDYTVIKQHPGQAVVTAPGSYHQGFNSTTCFTEAINYARHWNALDYARCNSECSIYQPEPEDFVPMNLAQSLSAEIHHEINSYERVTNASIARAQLSISEESPRSQKLGGSVAVSLTCYAIMVAAPQVLDAVRLAPSTGSAQSSPVSLSDDAGAHYHLLQRAGTYGFLGEVMMRIAAVGFYRIVDEALKENRRRRPHKKGEENRSKRRSEVLHDIATQILADLEPLQEALPTPETIVAQITSVFTCGKIFHGLAEKLGDGIIVLFPTADMIPWRHCDNPLAVLAMPDVIDVFCRCFRDLRPEYEPMYKEHYGLLLGHLLKSLEVQGRRGRRRA